MSNVIDILLTIANLYFMRITVTFIKLKKMVTIQDIGLQLTKPVKELAEWHFPFSQTLEKYCCLFNQTNNKSFGEAGLVLQNSTAVYVQRVDSLWTKMEYFRNVFSSCQHDEITKSSSSKGRRDKKTDFNFQNFQTINFSKEIEKNIDIKKNHIKQDTLKSKNRRFTQLEKGITQHISIDIYDVNGEIIGKKYDFRCNQNINMDGVLVDEFAPQDFCCSDDIPMQENSCAISSNYSRITESLEHSSNTLTLDSGVHDDDNESINSEFGTNCIDLSEKTSDLTVSFESSRDISRNTDTETLVDALPDPDPDAMCISTSNSINSPISNDVDNHTLSNNDADGTCLNNNIRNSTEISNEFLNSPNESVKSQEKRASLNNLSVSDVNEEQWKTNLSTNCMQNTPSKGSTRSKSRSRSLSKSGSKSSKRKTPVTPRRKGRVTKNLLNEFRSPQKKDLERILEKSNPLLQQKDKINILEEDLNACVKCIQQYNALQYDNVTNAALDVLGFRLHVSKQHTKSNNDMDNNIDTTNIFSSTEDEISEINSPTCADMSPLHESFCDTWLRSNSPQFLPENVDKWHELMQPKLREAEQRSTFCIRDYASRIIESLQANGQRKINFDTIIRKEQACEVARYFLASLDLASRQNVDINIDKNLEHNIEITLHEENGQYLSNGQLDLHH